MRLSDGKIAEYREVANSAIGLLDIGFAPERVAKILNKEAMQIKERPKWRATRACRTRPRVSMTPCGPAVARMQAQSRSSSLIEVFERVRSSTVFTITAQ